MQHTIEDKKIAFKPIKVEIVIESMRELNYMCAALGASADHLAADNDENIAATDMDENCCYTLWSELDNMRLERE